MAKQVLPTHTAPLPANGESDSLQKPASKLQSPLVAGAAYCSVSAAMVLLNKYALSGFDFNCPNMLLLAQCVTSVVIVKGAELLGIWKVEPLRWDIVKVCTLACTMCAMCAARSRPKVLPKAPLQASNHFYV